MLKGFIYAQQQIFIYLQRSIQEQIYYFHSEIGLLVHQISMKSSLYQIDGPRAKTLLKKLKKLFADLNQYQSISIETASFNSLDKQQGYGRLLDEGYLKGNLLGLT